MRPLLLRRLLERRVLDADRAEDPHRVRDDTALARGVHALQDQEDPALAALGRLGPEPLLQVRELGELVPQPLPLRRSGFAPVVEAGDADGAGEGRAAPRGDPCSSVASVGPRGLSRAGEDGRMLDDAPHAHPHPRPDRERASPRSGSAPGSSAATGATCRRRTRTRCSTPPPTPGVTLFDTADVYGDGRSERVIGAWLAANPDAGVTVATKMGRREAQVPSNYVLANFRTWTDRSRRNLGQDTLDLVQLHCPPTAVYEDDAVYDALDTLVAEGAIARLRRLRRGDRAGAHRDRAPARRDGADHPQRVPSEAARRGAARGRRRGGRHPRARAARLRAAVGQVRRAHRVRRRRPPQLQPARRGVRSGRDVLRRRLRRGRRGRAPVLRARRGGGTGGRRPRAGRDRLGRAAAGSHVRDPGRPLGRAGGVERGSGRGPGARRGVRRGRARHLRRDLPRAIHARW